MPIDREAVQKVIDLLSESSAGELEIEDGESTIRVVRGAGTVAPAQPEPVEAEDTGVITEAPVSVEPDPGATEPEQQLEYVTAGLVGLFHRGRQPDEEPIVEEGDEVAAGQVVATIEALRNVTDVVASCDGTVEEFLVADGAPVQYGDRLFSIRPQEE